MSRKDDIQELLIVNQRRLQKLKVQQAYFGIRTPTEVLLELEDIEAEIKNLQTELRKLSSNSEILLSHQVKEM